MKKWVYLLSGVIIGVAIASTSGEVLAQVKSLVGQTVTGEYTVTVNGKTLEDKGVVVGGRTNAPVRAISDAIGAQLTIEGKTINIVTTQGSVPNNGSTVSADNPHLGKTKKSLEELRASLVNNILTPTKAGREEIVQGLEATRKGGHQPSIEVWEKQLADYDAEIEKYTAELAQIDEALAELE